MKRFTSWCVQFTACFLLLAGIAVHAADGKAVDPTGTWTFSTPTRDGGTRESTLKIKKEGDKLVGMMIGNQGRETKLDNVKLTGEELSFDVTREFQGNSFTAKYKGKVSADAITGKVTTERGGQTNERDWVAKRKKEETK